MNTSLRGGMLALTLGTLTAGLPGAAAGEIELLGYSFDSSGSLWTLDQDTGAASGGVVTGEELIFGIAADADNSLYGLVGRLGPLANHLVRINPTTGALSDIGHTGMDVFEGDLAFDPTTGDLYGIQHGPADLALYLFRIDKTTAQGTIVGALNPTRAADFSAMAFDADGNLYVLDTQNERLLHVDESNAAILSSVPTGVPLGAGAGMAFHPATGALFVADGLADGTDTLYHADVETGNLTPIGSIGLNDGVQALTFIPEPSAAWIIAVGGALLLRPPRRT